LLLLSLICWKR